MGASFKWNPERGLGGARSSCSHRVMLSTRLRLDKKIRQDALDRMMVKLQAARAKT